MIRTTKERVFLLGSIQNRLENFRKTGGFTENMTAERLEVRKAQAPENGAPLCPKCPATATLSLSHAPVPA